MTEPTIWRPRRAFGPRRRREPTPSHLVDNQVIADILRSVADMRAANDDQEGAKRARAGARVVEGRDGPGERYRKHRRTQI